MYVRMYVNGVGTKKKDINILYLLKQVFKCTYV